MTQEGHLIWSLPLAIVLVTICLVLVMGPTTLVGVAVLILFVPLVERITARMLTIRQKRVVMTDERVGIVSAMLQGVRFVFVLFLRCLPLSCCGWVDGSVIYLTCVYCIQFLTLFARPLLYLNLADQSNQIELLRRQV